MHIRGLGGDLPTDEDRPCRVGGFAALSAELEDDDIDVLQWITLTSIVPRPSPLPAQAVQRSGILHIKAIRRF